MKASELMIGDWVQYDDGNLSFTTKIRGINEVEFEIGNINCTSTTLILCHYIKPIPITKEILKANGFVRSGMFMSRWWNNDDVVYADGSFDNHINISTCGTDFQAEYINIRIPFIGIGMPLYYVHELQHAFRLCGLTELADSFKIGGEE